MKQCNLIFPGIFKAILCVALFSTFTSCVVDNDDEMPVPADEDITFQVDLLKMTGIEIKEGEGEHLEIYGTISTKKVNGNVTEDNTLWSEDDTEVIYVGLSDYPLIASNTYTVSASELSSSNLVVIADLFDFDGGGNNAPEDLGKEEISTPLSSVTSSVTYQIVLNDSGGQHIRVTYSITRL